MHPSSFDTGGLLSRAILIITSPETLLEAAGNYFTTEELSAIFAPDSVPETPSIRQVITTLLTDKRLRTDAIFAAIRAGATDILHVLTTEGETTNKGWTALMQTAQFNQPGILSALLQRDGIDVNAADERGWTALTFAAAEDNVECIQPLLAIPDIELNKPDAIGFTPLIWSAYCGSAGALAALLATPKLNLQAYDQAFQALALASTEECERLLQTAIVKAKAKKCSERKTALRYAVEADFFLCIAELFQMGDVDVNEADSTGRTALIEAAASNRARSLMTLLTVPNINLNQKDNGGWTALTWAVIQNHSFCLKLLLHSGGNINVNTRDNVGWTALMIAASRNKLVAVCILLQANGIDANACSSYGQTALIFAALNGYVPVVAALLQSGKLDLAMHEQGKVAAALTPNEECKILIQEALNKAQASLAPALSAPAPTATPAPIAPPIRFSRPRSDANSPSEASDARHTLKPQI